MKLLWARFKNFRLLQDLELKFASDSDCKLTVIRAANESGKTTMLHALQWALYGENVLPKKSKGFRISPIDSPERIVGVSAEVRFEATKSASGRPETRQEYLIVRSAVEAPCDIPSSNTKSTVRLFEVGPNGQVEVPNPDRIISREIPLELREVFFTDGDQALSFIDTDITQNEKKRVKAAINILLRIDIIEALITRIKKIKRKLGPTIKESTGNNKLEQLQSDIGEITAKRDSLKEGLSQSEKELPKLDHKIADWQMKIEKALQKGDKEQLAKDIKAAEQDRKDLRESLKKANQKHSDMFRGQVIAIDLLKPKLNWAFDKLDTLHDQGQIPQITSPILEGCIAKQVCVCGESLSEDDQAAIKRLRHVEKLISDHRQSDKKQKILAELYYETKSLFIAGNVGWPEEFKSIDQERKKLQERNNEVDRKCGELEKRLKEAGKSLPIQDLREQLKSWQEQKEKYISDSARVKQQLDDLKIKRQKLEEEEIRLLKEDKRGKRVLAKKIMAQDLLKLLEASRNHLSSVERVKVSNTMNDIFLPMIGYKSQQSKIIKRAEISQECEILVYGPKERLLDPSRDLNGASRRALTLAFILALTKISEVDAPNIIDTPLGMTSGHVKREMFRMAIQESKQLVLFLTHDEIKGCEDIIDENAGAQFTFTNSGHYPSMIVNDPGTNGKNQVLLCKCRHDGVCDVCERHPVSSHKPN